jgi:hypothetical protein
MSPLAWSLATILALTLLLWWLAGLSDPNRTARVTISFFKIYAIIVAAVLVFTVWYHIGFARQGSRLLSSAEQTRVSHLGFYVDPEGSFRFVGDESQQGFHHPALRPGESITLQSDWKAKDWILRWEAGTAPLRVNGKCRNLPESWWFQPGDTLRVELSRQGRTELVEVHWEVAQGWTHWSDVQNSFFYSQGVLQGGRPDYSHGVRDRLLSRRALSEGRSLAVMARKASNLQDIVINEEWWDIFQRVFFVREIKGDKGSRLGVLVDPTLLNKPGLRFSKGSQPLASPVTWGEERIHAQDTIFYGLGYRDSLDLRLTGMSISDPVWGEVLEIRLGRKVSWPLPPNPREPFLLTSSSEHVPIDGYHLGLGGNSRPFYAKARINSSFDSINLVYGRGQRNWKLGETMRLGGVNEGFLLALERIEARLSYTGTWTVGIIMVYTLLFCLLFSRQESKGGARTDLAWTLLWGLTLTLLVVRLMLAYRVSLLPPENARPGELETFHTALVVSFTALAAGPAVLLLARFFSLVDWPPLLNRRSGIRAFLSWVSLRRDLLLFLGGTAVLLWVAAAKVFGSNESFLGLRINLSSHLMIVLMLALGTGTFLGYKQVGKWAVVAAMGLVVAVVFWTGDRGFLIYVVSLALTVLCFFLWDTEQRRSRIAWWFVPFALISALLLLPFFPSLPFAQKLIDPRLPETVRYRLASFADSQDSMLLTPRGETELSVDQLLGNSQQAWQMRLYASTGLSSPQGYGRMPLSDSGMTYATSLADCVFAVYFLSEHGAVAGFLLVLVYVILGLICLWAIGFLPKELQHRAIPLIAIAAFFICNALYMASANVGLTVFTGQNMPLLALYSKLDAIHGLILLTVVTLLLRIGIVGSIQQRNFHSWPIHRALAVFTGMVTVWLFLLGHTMYRLGTDPSFRRNFDFSDKFFEKIDSHVAAINNQGVQNSPWELVGHRLRRKPYGEVTAAEEAFAEQLNERPNKLDPNGGLFFLEWLHGGDGKRRLAVQVNRHFFKMRSPLARDHFWSGRIVARRAPEQPTISGLGQPFRVTMGESGAAHSLPLSESPPMQVNHAVIFTEAVQSTSNEFLEIYRQGNDLVLVPKRGGWKVYVEGQEVHKSIKLEKFDLIGIAKGKDYQRDFMYLGFQPTVLAYVQWRNGSQRRFFPEGRNFPMAYALGKAMDRSRSLGSPTPETIALTIDMELQRALQAEVTRLASKPGEIYSNDPVATPLIAVTVLDPHTGEVLAMPSWPALDPNDPGFENLVESSSSRQQARLITNPNLRRHAIGSTFKPLLFAGLASQFWPEIQLDRLSVIQEPQAAQIKIAGLPIEPWENLDAAGHIDAEDYLIHSRNPYQVMIGFLGMLLDRGDAKDALSASGVPNFSYMGKDLTLNLRNVNESPFTLADQLPRPRTDAMARTLLFQGLKDLYGVGVNGDPTAERLQECRGLLPSLGCSEKLLQSNEYLDNVVAEPVDFSPSDFQSIRKDIITFLLGAGECRWNNLRLSEAWSRVLTGAKVQVTLESKLAASSGPIPAAVWLPLPQPVGNNEWRRDHILRPLHRVGTEGTAARLSSLNQGPLVTFYKTGTIDEGTPGRESELLLFALSTAPEQALEPGRALAGVVYLEDSKASKGNMQKFDAGQCILSILAQRLVKDRSEFIPPVACSKSLH